MRSRPVPALAGAWTADQGTPGWRELREAARFACESCPALAACRDWVLLLPTWADDWLLERASGVQNRRPQACCRNFPEQDIM